MASHNINAKTWAALYSRNLRTSVSTGVVTSFEYPHYQAVVGKRDVKVASSNGRWPLLAGVVNCTNPYSRYVCNFDVGTALGTYVSDGGTSPSVIWDRRGNFLVPFSDYIAAGPSTDILADAVRTCIVGITGKYQKAVQSFQSGVALGELRETLRMIRSPAKSLRDSITPYRHRQRRWVNGRQTRARKQAIADTYLEWTFGVMPFVSDIRSAMEAYNRLIERPHVERLKYTVPFENYARVATELETYKSVYDGFNHVRVDIWSKHKGGVRCVGDFTIDVAANKAKLFGSELEDFVPTAWNLLPYSFLIDYFSNVGDVLSSACAATATYNWLSMTKRIEGEWKANVVSTHATCRATPSGFEGPKTFTLQRSIPSLTTSFSDARLEMPAFDENAKQWLNIAALLEARRADRAFANSSAR